MLRYLAFVWDSRDIKSSFAVSRLTERLRHGQSSWSQSLDSSGLQVFCAGVREGASGPTCLQSNSGVVIGTIFERPRHMLAPGTPRKTRLAENETRTLIASRGKNLMTDYWGRYVAFLTEPSSSRKWIVRDPTAGLPCFSTRVGDITVYFSYIGDCLEFGIGEFSVNWEHMATRVATGSFYAERSALNEIAEVYGGECIEYNDGKVSRSFYWHPYAIARSSGPEDWHTAAAELRATTKFCTHAWASCHEHVLLRLSGGLDSSTVLHCLKDAPERPRLTCLTFHVPGGISDERPWARLAVRGIECEHLERPRDVNGGYRALLDLQPSADPPPHLVFVETSRAEAALARPRGATAVLDGTGGDFLFGAYKSLAPVDYFYRRGLRPELFKVAEDVAVLTNDSIWKVLSNTAKDVLFKPQWELQKEISEYKKFVTADARAAAAGRNHFTHPWFQSVGVENRSTLYLMLHFTTPDQFYDPLLAPQEQQLEPLSPLIAQPIVELCLRTPPHFHVKEGRDRALAREAFSKDLPREIVSRLWKDRAPGFLEASLVASTRFIRELLLDGVLVKERLLDARRIEEMLSGAPSKGTGYPAELCDHMITEAWLRSWAGVKRAATEAA